MTGMRTEPAEGGSYNGRNDQEGRKVLLTGEQGYIVTCLEKWLVKQEGIEGKSAGRISEIKKISLRGEAWRQMDFSGYDCIVHLAGLAHGREKQEGKDFAAINTALTEELAQKAKKEGVGHFVFISTMAVYGAEDSLKRSAVINECTPLAPLTAYGKSKLAAEKALADVAATQSGFTLALIRPPMVYGPGCPGNYQSLRKLVLKAKVFPRYDKARSMIFIDNLCELIRLVIVNRSAGIFTPQNREYVQTWQMAMEIGRNNGVNIWCSSLLNPLIRIVSGIAGSLPGSSAARIADNLAKVFGSLVYDKSLSSHFDYRYCVCDFKESMRRTEKS